MRDQIMPIRTRSSLGDVTNSPQQQSTLTDFFSSRKRKNGEDCSGVKSTKGNDDKQTTSGVAFTVDCMKKPLLLKRISSDGPLGYFDALPTELMLHVFEKLDVLLLASLSQSSKLMRDVIMDHTKSYEFKRRLAIIERRFASESDTFNRMEGVSELCKQLGVLFKKMTCLITTVKRLAFVKLFFHDFIDWCSGGRTKSFLKFMTDFPSPKRYEMAVYVGRLFQTFIHGWEHKECDRAYDAIQSWMETDRALQLVLSNNIGSTEVMQMQVVLRTIYRAIFVDDATITCPRHHNNDTAYWLWTIMKHYGFQDQVRLWYLLFGPTTTTTGYIDWAKISMITSPQIFGVCANRIGDLMCRVQRYNQSMHTKNHLRSMTESLLALNGQWSPESTAWLLLPFFSIHTDIVWDILAPRVERGEYDAVSTILVQMGKGSNAPQGLATLVSALMHYISSTAEARVGRALRPRPQ